MSNSNIRIVKYNEDIFKIPSSKTHKKKPDKPIKIKNGGKPLNKSIKNPETSLKYIIKPEYLMGYIDTESTTFIPNPNFNPTPIQSNKWWSNPIQNITKPKFTHIPQINQNNQKYPEVW